MTNKLNSKPQILIVDDDKINLQVLGDVLKDDYSVIVANSGREALEVFYKMEKADMILLDIVMLDMNGFEVCSEIKKAEKGKDIPIIFVTSLDDNINENTGYSVGAVDYISKPIIPAIVLERVKLHLRHQSYSTFIEDLLAARDNEVRQRELLQVFYEFTSNGSNSEPGGGPI